MKPLIFTSIFMVLGLTDPQSLSCVSDDRQVTSISHGLVQVKTYREGWEDWPNDWGISTDTISDNYLLEYLLDVHSTSEFFYKGKIVRENYSMDTLTLAEDRGSFDYWCGEQLSAGAPYILIIDTVEVEVIKDYKSNIEGEIITLIAHRGEYNPNCIPYYEYPANILSSPYSARIGEEFVHGDSVVSVPYPGRLYNCSQGKAGFYMDSLGQIRKHGYNRMHVAKTFLREIPQVSVSQEYFDWAIDNYYTANLVLTEQSTNIELYDTTDAAIMDQYIIEYAGIPSDPTVFEWEGKYTVECQTSHPYNPDDTTARENIQIQYVLARSDALPPDSLYQNTVMAQWTGPDLQGNVAWTNVELTLPQPNIIDDGYNFVTVQAVSNTSNPCAGKSIGINLEPWYIGSVQKPVGLKLIDQGAKGFNIKGQPQGQGSKYLKVFTVP